jgi:hypothetical protein
MPPVAIDFFHHNTSAHSRKAYLPPPAGRKSALRIYFWSFAYGKTPHLDIEVLLKKNQQIQESFSKIHLDAFFAPQKTGLSGGSAATHGLRPCAAAAPRPYNPLRCSTPVGVSVFIIATDYDKRNLCNPHNQRTLVKVEYDSQEYSYCHKT